MEPIRDDDQGEPTPLRLCKQDRRKLYALIDADLPARIRRLELGMAALFVMGGSQLYALLGGAPANPVTSILQASLPAILGRLLG